MNHDYVEFLYSNSVISIPTEREFIMFVDLMKELGINEVNHLEKLYNKYGFDNAFCYNAGIRNYPNEDLVFCFNYEHGFIPNSKDFYLGNNPDMKIITLDNIIKATNFKENSQKLYMVIGSGIDEKTGEEWYEHILITTDEQKAIEVYKKVNKFQKYEHVQLVNEGLDKSRLNDKNKDMEAR